MMMYKRSADVLVYKQTANSWFTLMYNGQVSCFGGEKNSIMVITSSGSVHTCTFDPDGPAGQDLKPENTYSFLQKEEGTAAPLQPHIPL